MCVEIIHDVPVSPNLEAQSRVSCAGSFAHRLPDSELICAYRRGAEKHSYDGCLVLQKSSDHGRTWAEPVTVFDGRGKTPPECVVAGTVGQAEDGALLFPCGIVEATRPWAYLFSPEGRTQKRRVILVRSHDGARTFSPPSEIVTSVFPFAGITTKPIRLPGGTVLVPLELRLENGANATGIARSQDGGRTFGLPYACAADGSGRKSLCDARWTVLDGGAILMLLWTFLTESEKTVDVHQVFSSDGGRTWTAPAPTGMAGQIAAPLSLPGGRVIAACNCRTGRQGIRLYVSTDCGRSWETDAPIMMWDAAESRVMGTPPADADRAVEDRGVWHALPNFSFGTPDLVALPDGTILMTYHATVTGINHVRACRFQVL